MGHFSHGFFGDFPWQAHLHLQPSRRRLCRAGTQQSTGKGIHGDFTRQNGGLKPQKTERGAQHLKYVQRKDGNPLNFPGTPSFCSTIFGMRGQILLGWVESNNQGENPGILSFFGHFWTREFDH